MNETRAFSKPLNVEVVDGEVVVLGPQGPTGLSLTPSAAAETAARMAAAAEVARTQASQTWSREP